MWPPYRRVVPVPAHTEVSKHNNPTIWRSQSRATMHRFHRLAYPSSSSWLRFGLAVLIPSSSPCRNYTALRAFLSCESVALSKAMHRISEHLNSAMCSNLRRALTASTASARQTRLTWWGHWTFQGQPNIIKLTSPERKFHPSELRISKMILCRLDDVT